MLLLAATIPYKRLGMRRIRLDCIEIDKYPTLVCLLLRGGNEAEGR
jgi:hypothetical protein